MYMPITDQMSSAMLAAVLEDVCLLLRSRSREVVKGALAFTKVLVASYPVTTLAQHLKPLVCWSGCTFKIVRIEYTPNIKSVCGVGYIAFNFAITPLPNCGCMMGGCVMFFFSLLAFCWLIGPSICWSVHACYP
ncbi:hypothetical protein DPMN_166003 [Dreissena polymorpha]|uniref:Uncharacterized protein n=1 Tax=Dreissena polymorpha TaxID=45954 RepID=A0A9D4EX74_DREPO|nr:hypothetical protein DPMN_166003 [Dreissena polymorpha]